ncbi:Os08g0193600 [Oryza sativa Japonica Group]|uniref:F-box protein-like n=1 Tax=Oryza sativa subsp. japonica TaxID=39947 RepID=Q6Z1B3_ORYSJ|nr:F-box protein-like [Oryza sativa Japonica Group]BAF23095.1 Os08g0193600 [Oryza sativa Japonica Group]|eukprot:NP_001061181.1 Os08g0193600 [Oryza sativa Japonica Group]
MPYDPLPDILRKLRDAQSAAALSNPNPPEPQPQPQLATPSFPTTTDTASRRRRRRRRRGRGNRHDPQPEAEVEEDTTDRAELELPYDPLPDILREFRLAPRAAALPSPNPNPNPAIPSSTTSRRRRRRGRGRGRGRRDWAAGLPREAILAVLRKLDHMEILMGAGQVCRAWRRAARDDPQLWRRIDMLNHAELSFELNLFGMAQAAVRRSAGQCEAFWGEYAPTKICSISSEIATIIYSQMTGLWGDAAMIIRFLTIVYEKRAPCLKSLRLISCFDILDEGFSAAVKKFPLLEELELTLCDNLGENDVFKAVGKACPQLKRFRLSKRCFYNYKHSGYNKDEQALGIATMHELSSLQLFANNLSNEGLTAILDNCPFLESLDIRHCFNVSMDDTLQAKCARIKTLRLPYDSTDDYDFQVHKPIWSGADFFSDSDDDCIYGGPDYILDSDEYDDYCDPYIYLDGVYEDELDEEDRMMLKAMHMFLK